ncbi:MAG: carbohydrate-binding domain-containing protein [Atopobiaceae bacterium]|nr:carbohydrate-binding domain-containing protein [Atopobiaceae bacterium]
METKRNRPILLIVMAALLAFAMSLVPGVRAYAAGEELVLSGGELGVDYTYENGVLTILRSGEYTLSMADGVSSTSHRVVISAPGRDVTDLTLTLDNLNMSGAASGITANYSSTQWNCTYILVGDNTITGTYHPINNISNVANGTIEGDGSLTLISTESPEGYNNFNFNNLTIESGTIELQNGDIFCNDSFTMNGGSLTIGCIDECLYVRNSLTINDGTLNLTSGSSALGTIRVLGRSGMEGKVDILGGTVTINASSVYGGLMVGDSGNKRDVTINADVTITTETAGSGYGMLLSANSNLEMQGGNLRITAPTTGIHANGRNSQTTVTFSGGETEIATDGGRGINLANTPTTDPSFSEGYTHKNYSGSTAGTREEISDTDLTNDSGYTEPYVLITPAWPITYDLGNGALPEGESNPELYSRVDSFTLVNPEPANPDAMRFLGWIGTDLESETETVTVPEGSKGERAYTAVYESILEKIESAEPTCTEDGNIEYYVNPANGHCYADEAGEQLIDEADTVIPALGHDWGEWETTKEPTATESGESQRVCKNDPTHVETETIPPLGPEPAPAPASSPAPSPKPMPATPTTGEDTLLANSAMLLLFAGSLLTTISVLAHKRS